MTGLEPVYSVDGETDVRKWNYTPHKKSVLSGEITQNEKASGYRLPTNEEWEYAARGGQYYRYSGSNNLDEVAGMTTTAETRHILQPRGSPTDMGFMT